MSTITKEAVYKTSDGKKHDTHKGAQDHQKDLDIREVIKDFMNPATDINQGIKHLCDNYILLLEAINNILHPKRTKGE